MYRIRILFFLQTKIFYTSNNIILTERKVPKFIGNMNVFSFIGKFARSIKSLKLDLNDFDLGSQSTW